MLRIVSIIVGTLCVIAGIVAKFTGVVISEPDHSSLTWILAGIILLDIRFRREQ